MTRIVCARNQKSPADRVPRHLRPRQTQPTLHTPNPSLHPSHQHLRKQQGTQVTVTRPFLLPSLGKLTAAQRLPLVGQQPFTAAQNMTPNGSSMSLL